MTKNLPSFKKPPLVETALSVQFKPVDGFGNAHLGLFWHERLRGKYPRTTDADPIVPQTELFGTDINRKPRLPSFRIVASQGSARLQMFAADELAMVQVQNGRLVFNWRRLTEGTYPRWNGVLPAFQLAWTEFCDFVSRCGLGPIEPNLWEVIYVNHLYKGQDWRSEADVHRLLPGLVGHTGMTEIGQLESLECNLQFALPDHRSRLRVGLSHGFTATEPVDREVLVLQLTARGNLSATDELIPALANGRQAIVRMFDEVTSPAAHAIWEREE